MTKKTFFIVAGILLAVTAVAGYFLVGPGSDGGYGTNYNVTDTDDTFRGGY